MRKLPMLDAVRVASPCNASWNEMVGDDRVRFCGSCQKNVYNLSAMLSHEAEELLGLNGELCVRFYQRADGTVMTQDCPVGVKKKQRKKLALSVAGAGALAAAAVSALFHEQSHKKCSVMMGDVASPTEPAGTVPPVMGEPMVMGSMVAPTPPPPPPKPTTDEPVLMGRRAPTKHVMGKK